MAFKNVEENNAYPTFLNSTNQFIFHTKRLGIKMSETIDLTGDHSSDDTGRKSDQTNHQESKRKRLKTNSRPKSVHIVIHDKEPPSDVYDRYSFLPTRQDTQIISIHYNYSDAVSAAVEYVIEEFDLYEDESDDGDDRNPLSHVDWREGWLREEEYDANACDDRVRIVMHDVK